MKKKPIGLALGGGGTKGFVHLGVIKYLEENNYEIVEIAGTSIGAIVGLLLANGMNYAQIYAIASDLGYLRVLDWTMKKGLMTGDSILDILKECKCDGDFESLGIPLTIVATNLTTAEEKRFTSGSVLDAVRCSMGIPGIFPPHELADAQHYVDGVFVNNLPVNCLSSESVVAVSTLGIGDFESETSRSLLGFDINTTRLTMPKKALNRSISILLSRYEDLLVDRPDDTVVIRPVIDHLSLIDLSILDEAVQLGYDAAGEALGG